MKNIIFLILLFTILSCKKKYTVEVYEETNQSLFYSDKKTNKHEIEELNDKEAYEHGYTLFLGSKRANKMLEEKGIQSNEEVTGFNVYNDKHENIDFNVSYEFKEALRKKYKSVSE